MTEEEIEKTVTWFYNEIEYLNEWIFSQYERILKTLEFHVEEYEECEGDNGWMGYSQKRLNEMENFFNTLLKIDEFTSGECSDMEDKYEEYLRNKFKK